MASSGFLHNVKQEFKEFCEASSLKGVPKIIKSADILLKSLWAIIVLFTVSMAFYQAYLLFNLYLSYPVIVNTVDYDLTDRNQFAEVNKKYNFSFPDITLCNLNYLSSDGQRNLSRSLTLQQYHSLLETASSSDETNEFENKFTLKLWNNLYYYGYLSNIDQSEIQTVALQKGVFINSCHVLQFHATGYVEASCEENTTITEVYTTDYFKCFTVNTHSLNTVGISLILYLDNFSDHMPLYFDSFENRQQETGARVSVQAPSVYPDVKYQGSNIMPGRHVTIDLEYTGSLKKPEPYGRCTTEGIQITDNLNHSTKYTLQNCYFGCQHRAVINNCECRSNGLGVILGKLPDDFYNLSFCNTLEHDIRSLLEKIQCEEMAILSANCVECLPPCNQVKYTMSQSQSKWPARNNILGFYWSRIAHRSYEHHFWQYQNISTAWLNGSLTQDEAMSAAASVGLIEDNFVKVTIMMNSLFLYSFETEAAFTPEILLSQLGGTLNLWAGITVIFFIEVVEAIIKLCLKCFPKNDNVKKTSKVMPENNVRKLKRIILFN